MCHRIFLRHVRANFLTLNQFTSTSTACSWRVTCSPRSFPRSVAPRPSEYTSIDCQQASTQSANAMYHQHCMFGVGDVPTRWLITSTKPHTGADETTESGNETCDLIPSDHSPHIPNLSLLVTSPPPSRPHPPPPPQPLQPQKELTSTILWNLEAMCPQSVDEIHDVSKDIWDISNAIKHIDMQRGSGLKTQALIFSSKQNYNFLAQTLAPTNSDDPYDQPQEFEWSQTENISGWDSVKQKWRCGVCGQFQKTEKALKKHHDNLHVRELKNKLNHAQNRKKQKQINVLVEKTHRLNRAGVRMGWSESTRRHNIKDTFESLGFEVNQNAYPLSKSEKNENKKKKKKPSGKNSSKNSTSNNNDNDDNDDDECGTCKSTRNKRGLLARAQSFLSKSEQGSTLFAVTGLVTEMKDVLNQAKNAGVYTVIGYHEHNKFSKKFQPLPDLLVVFNDYGTFELTDNSDAGKMLKERILLALQHNANS